MISTRTKPKLVAVAMLAFLAWLELVFAALAESAQPIKVHPTSPRYFQFRGRPTVLIGSSGDYMRLSFSALSYSPLIDKLAADGIQHMRVFTDIAKHFGVGEPPQTAATLATYNPPWAWDSATSKWDLNTWNTAWFTRLTNMVSYARSKNIIVEIVLFTHQYSATHWNTNPLKSANNKQGIGTITYDKYVRTVAAGNQAALIAEQKKLARKVLETLRNYENVYYTICNEGPNPPDGIGWQNEILADLINYENNVLNQSAANRHIFASNAGFVTNVATWDQQSPKPHFVVRHYWCRLFGGSSLCPTEPGIMNGLYNGRVVPLGSDESDVTAAADFGSTFSTPQEMRLEAWSTMLFGAAIYDNLNWSWNNTNGQTVRNYIKTLKNFYEKLDFAKMSKNTTIIASLPSGSFARAISEPGRQYALYRMHAGMPRYTHYSVTAGTWMETWTLKALPAAIYTARWVNPSTGAMMGMETTFTHAGGDKNLTTPTYGPDIALRLMGKASAADGVAPVRSGLSPSGSLYSSTVVLYLNTNEIANCKYSPTAGVAYGSMANSFTTDGGRAHTAILTGLTSGTKTYYVRCQDTYGATNTSDSVIGFSKMAAPMQGILMVHDSLSMLWSDLAQWLDATRVLGPYPQTQLRIGEGSSQHTAGTPFALDVAEGQAAAMAWEQFQAGESAALNSPELSRILEDLGYLMGERLGLGYAAATHFGDWLAQAITGISGGHGNAEAVEWLDDVASRTVYGERTSISQAWYSPDFWDTYADAAWAVVAALREWEPR